MIELGKYNTLKAFRESDFGWYLADAEMTEEVLLPKNFVPEGMKENDEIEVFIYNDHEDRVTATTQKPLITLNTFAYLEVFQISEFGAFMNWGLDKHLLVPFSQQKEKMVKGESYIIYLYRDEMTDRLVGASKIHPFLERENLTVAEGDQVDLLIDRSTDIGVNVIINNKHAGLIYQNEIFQNIKRGDRVTGFIKQIREDGKIDVSLQKQGYQNIIPESAKFILEKIKAQNGFLNLTDKSDPTEIYRQLEMSKKSFKKAIGALYKQKLVRLEKDGIYLA